MKLFPFLAALAYMFIVSTGAIAAPCTLPYDTFTAGKPIFAFQEVANNIALRESVNHIESPQIVNGTISTSDIADNAITADKLSDSISLSIPIGTILPFAGDSPPSASYLICDGRAVSRTIYAGLFAIVGTKYGVGDGASTFNVPDLRARVAVGANPTVVPATVIEDTRSVRTVGDTGGVETHVLTDAEMPSHNGHHSSAVAVDASGLGTVPAWYNTVYGDDKPHINMQPFIVLNFIIFAGIV